MPNVSSRFTVHTAEEKPELLSKINELTLKSFPAFLFQGDPPTRDYWDSMLERHLPFQFALFEGEEMVGGGVTVPLEWDGTLEDLPENFERILHARGTPNVLCATAGLVVEKHQGRGISRDVLLAMKHIASQHDFSSLVVPVRPNHKQRYPLLPMEEYLKWRRDDGLLFDPWIRTHERLEATILKVMSTASIIPATVKQWEEWTGMRFMSDGQYVIPGGLAPLEISLSKDEGVYIEPNVWMEHKVDL
ncbi:hypothetical protein C8J48_3367 [Desmospora activa DSM 45169]|uniref:Acetyltransferase (GNAT) family protein n=2 Tax=Desmospora TaxID=500614 RepID=A0A2T4Z1Q6_9BACL|nr:hypothetical protein C8J48_3367 [Desmospora activa DSM 45169]